MTSSPRSPMRRSTMGRLPNMRERREDRRPRYDAGEPALLVDDGHRHDLAAGEVHEVADDGARLDGVELLADRAFEVAVAAACRLDQSTVGGDAEQALVVADHERSGGLVLPEPAQRRTRVL